MMAERASRSLPFAFAREGRVLLSGRNDAGVEVLVCDETKSEALSELARVHGQLALRHLPLTEWKSILGQTYAQGEGGAAEVVGEVEEAVDLSRLMEEIPAVEDLLESRDDAPVIRMINALLTEAVREGASDIHIEPSETASSVRFRVDGTLRDVVQPKKALHAALISRIKIMAQLDIAEKRLPQDGRIALKIGGRSLDVRVSTLPTGFGERAVLRLLEKDTGKLDLAKLGMAGDTLETFDELLHRPHGMILVTGPTGSGKTTTLYAGLTRLDTQITNVMTVEDPIEYHLEGIGQTQVNPRIDLSFARVLRAILRQDPDVIMVGEIRDAETAQIAVQASLTGHLVLATLHTNDAASAVTRLVDMGIEPFLLSSSLLAVLSQRLVRCVCPACHNQPGQVEQCTQCGRTGYQGRRGIYELMRVNEPIRALIHGRAAEAEVQKAARVAGMRSLREDGERWVNQGVTSREEWLRVTGDVLS